MSKATHLRLNSLSAAHTDENEDQHQHIRDSWVVEHRSQSRCDFGLRCKVVRRHRFDLFCFKLFSSLLVACLARSVFAVAFRFDFMLGLPDGAFFEGLAERFTLAFFFVVMRRDLTMTTTPKRRCPGTPGNRPESVELLVDWSMSA